MILWDVTDLTQLGRIGDPLTGHADTVTSVAFTPDGRTLATGRFDGAVIPWDVSDPTKPRRIGDPLIGPTGAVSSVAFTPDGRTLGTGGDSNLGVADGSVILWDVSDPSQARRVGDSLAGHIGSVLSVAFTPDGRTLATGSTDKTVTLWNVAGIADLREHLHQRAWAVAGRGRSADIWFRYIPDLPLMDPCT